MVLPSENRCFLAYFHPPQNLKVASCKGYRVLVRSKKAKKNIVIANFSKIETHLKALYVRLKGIPEGGLKALQIKGFKGGINILK